MVRIFFLVYNCPFKISVAVKGKIFKSEDCVICLESDIDCVLYSCAHKCGHSTCLETLNKCPVCRKSIIAKLKQ